MSYKSWVTVLQLQPIYFRRRCRRFWKQIHFIDIGAYGKQSDGGTFSASTLCRFFEDYEPTLPKSANFEGSGTEMPFVILGDEAYPVKTYLMKPFAGKDLSCFQLQAVASKAMRWVCFWYPNSKMAIVKQSSINERQ